MVRALLLGFGLLSLAACSSSWDPVDHDGDGFSALDGDCWDATGGPAGTDLSGADIFPGASESFYDGIDQDCAQDDDFDADADGYVPDEYVGVQTEGVPGSGELPGGDCWDDPSAMTALVTVVGSDLTDKNGDMLDWAQPAAGETHPGADDSWYDGLDQDCAGDDDFDQDLDGYRTEGYPDQQGEYGDDCVDGNDLDDENFSEAAPADVNPAATEIWYDGTDDNCDDNDCDQDGDGYPVDGLGQRHCETEECDDTDASIYPDDSIVEIWYNGIDENCDGDDGDQDGDGYWVDDYDARVLSSGSGEDPLDVPEGSEDDCWDVPEEVEAIPTDFTAINGFEQPTAAEVFPTAEDTWYDAVDQDCAEDSDFDQDADSYTTDVYPDREAEYGTDCDDTDNNVFPGQFETYYDGTDDNCNGNDGDADSDGYWAEDYEGLVAAAGGTPLDIPEDCGDLGNLPCDGDCNDADADVHPDRLEDCSTEYDDDCDGDLNWDDDPGDAIDCTTYYEDTDDDAYGSTNSYCFCEAAGDYDVLNDDDCDDGDADTNPGADEYCDGHDDDCDGDVDEDSAVDALTWYQDADSDTYGNPSVSDVECYQPSGYVLDNTDCDDTRALTNPAATEYCNYLYDDDCDGTIDEASAVDADTWYLDSDEDGYGDPAISQVACEMYQPTGYILDNTDCDDSDAGDYPGAPEVVANDDDEDCDGGDTCYDDWDLDTYGTLDGDTVLSADTDCADSGESYTMDDCDDAEPTTNPGALEYCDGHDDDCDGEVDEDNAVDALTWYEDDDGDTYGNPSVDDDECYQPSGYVLDDTDCDDTDAGDYPGATEVVANGDDEDCDGGDTCYEDLDLDTYGTSSTVNSTDLVCTDSGESEVDTDCDDGEPTTYPGAAEVIADGVDQDCANGDTCYEDNDGDTYGTVNTQVSIDLDCSDTGESYVDTDCDDTEATTYPGATEVVNDGVDNDCSSGDLCYYDADYDGYGTSTTVVSADLDCSDTGESIYDTDCDDAESTTYPGATEVIADGVDQDCANGDTCYEDNDGDTYGTVNTQVSIDLDCSDTGESYVDTDCDDTEATTYPGATEVVNDGVDNDCSSGDLCYLDLDYDGYGTSSTVVSADLDCADTGESAYDTDCDDAVASTYPGATEVVDDGVDNDCDSLEACYEDLDGDNYGTASTVSSSDLDCSDSGESSYATDCDDTVASTYPGATEVVNDGVDNDCNAGDACYEDLDGDGYGTATEIDSSDLDCADSGESTLSTDCDDAVASTYPGATEVVDDGVDNDCSSGDTCYGDSDGDGYGTASTVVSTDLDCSDSGESSLDTDCDDAASSVYPGATEVVADGIDQDCANGDTCYEDNDLDGYGSTGTQVSVDLDCSDSGESSVDTDCDDTDAAQYPGADEYCNGEDDDCDGTTDEDSAVDVATWYLDYDGDSYGDSSFSDVDCDQPTGYVSESTDCDDSDAAQYPGADEYCNSEDDDCDGTTDEDSAVDATTWYADSDSDTYGDVSTSDVECSAPSGYVGDNTDCDDDDAAQYPGADEYCNSEDDDCDGSTDEGAVDATTFYADSDSDGYGDASTTQDACSTPSGYVSDSTDCDDEDSAQYPGADEYCNSEDDDCDGSTDEGAVDATTWYADADSDTYGDSGSTQAACSQPSGYVSDTADCLDSDDAVYPGALEICDDGLVNDCDEADGGSAGHACPVVGDLVVSEVMPNPSVLSDASGEWIEVYNASASDIDLEGMLVYDDGSDSDQILSSVVVTAGGFVTLVRNASALREYDYVLSDFTLTNLSSGDEVILATYGTDGTDGTVIDEVWFDDTWPWDDGASMALDAGNMTAVANNTDTNWNESECYYSIDNSGASLDYDMGTPGGENDLGCPLIDQIDPSEIDLSGDDTITITGTDLAWSSGDVVVTAGVWGTDTELTPDSTADTAVDFTAESSASQDSADIVLYNGINLALLEDGLNWVEIDTTYIWWPIPSTHASYGQDFIADSGGGSTLEAGEDTEDIYGRVYHVGVADCTSEPSDYDVDLGYGPTGTDPRYDASWTWIDTQFNSSAADCTAYHSEYYAQLESLSAGTYDFTFRYSYDSGPWVYGELRGDSPYTETEGPSGYAPGEVFDLDQLGTFTVN